ncbi:Rha family transcriptional regulator [Lysinibacillus fusiformis]|uniref:Rha family transcriptional regulator n=1 Tax=Lysinibacillus fusiformis TaxID=28031 RepID=UPI002EAA91DF|nr:Rha family transcriptional regulator [Lysinibacillus fusiformis]
MNLVIIQNRQAVTTSLQVAQDFEKGHNHVLRDIDALREGVQNWTDLFKEDVYEHPQNKQQYRMFYMNRDGFTLLAMGFNGNKALDFKLKYIQAFNEMERQLRQPTTAELIAMMAQQGVEQERRINAVEQRTNHLEAQQENITQIVSLNPNEWKDKTNVILNKIALARGGGEQYRLVRNESYELLEKRGHCRLNIRLENRKKEALSKGIISKAKIEKFKKIDVIADDPKLVEIYLAIVKEMAITHKIKVEGLGA